MTELDKNQIEDCYIRYCAVIKPLIANIESLSEKIPLPLFNEIRAFNDHIARCYYLNPDDAFIKEQITKAQRHIERITLDCFKCLNVILYQRIELFEKQTRNIDLTVIDNGEFFPEYSKMKLNAAKLVKSAKLEEARVSKRIITVIAWIVSVIISAILSAIFSCELIASLMD